MTACREVSTPPPCYAMNDEYVQTQFWWLARHHTHDSTLMEEVFQYCGANDHTFVIDSRKKTKQTSPTLQLGVWIGAHEPVASA